MLIQTLWCNVCTRWGHASVQRIIQRWMSQHRCKQCVSRTTGTTNTLLFLSQICRKTVYKVIWSSVMTYSSASYRVSCCGSRQVLAEADYRPTILFRRSILQWVTYWSIDQPFTEATHRSHLFVYLHNCCSVALHQSAHCASPVRVRQREPSPNFTLCLSGNLKFPTRMPHACAKDPQSADWQNATEQPRYRLRHLKWSFLKLTDCRLFSRTAPVQHQ